MTRHSTIISTILVSLLLTSCAGSSPSGGQSKGIVYKPTDPATNNTAAGMIKTLLSSKQAKGGLAKSPILCGPFLWDQIKHLPEMTAIEKGQAIMMIPTQGGVYQMEGKLFQSDDEAAAFWRSFFATLDLGAFRVRKLTKDEINIFWQMNAWDIEEPVFIAEGNGHKILFDFVKQDNGQLELFYIDDLWKVALR